jgi:predicted enzyme related to lactoylglutathione lyase
MKYKHTNIIAKDWQSLARFYEEVFGCIRVLPERHLEGEWLAKGTGVLGARFSGVHLRLPGCGDAGPTLEIYQYSRNEPKGAPAANREGFSHIAFEVEDVPAVMNAVLAQGGSAIGTLVTQDLEGIGRLTFVYASDPEGNILELQSWG